MDGKSEKKKFYNKMVKVKKKYLQQMPVSESRCRTFSLGNGTNHKDRGPGYTGYTGASFY